MTMAKILASYDASDIDNEQGTTSGIEPTDEGAEYHDPLSGQVLKDDNGAALLALVQQGGGDFVNKADIKSRIDAGTLTGNIKTTDGEEWVCVMFDLTAYQDPPAARKIIIDTLANPNYQARKNQGKGRFQDIDVKGKRGVIAWGIHKNQQGIGPHFHAFVHIHAIDGNKVCPRAKLSDTHILPLEEKAINDALQAAGLAPLSLLSSAASQSTPQAKAANAAVANAVATGATLPPPAIGVAPTMSQVQMNFVELAEQKQHEAAKLYEQAQRAANESAIYAQAQQAVSQYQQVLANQEQIRVEFDQVKANHAELAKKHHATHNEKEALALGLVNLIGLDEAKSDLPTNELLAEAGQAYSELARKHQEEVDRLQVGNNKLQAIETIINETGFPSAAALVGAFNESEKSLQQEQAGRQATLGLIVKAGYTSIDDLLTQNRMLKKADENRKELLEKCGVKTVKELAELTQGKIREASEAKARADQAEREAKKQADELRKQAEKLAKEQTDKATLSGELKAAKEALNKALRQNTALIAKLTPKLTPKKPAPK